MATKKSINICILFGILIIAAWLAKSEIDGVEFFFA
jgi:hypothetical protein